MANRSYLYAVDAVPGEPGAQTTVRPVGEWKWDVPIAHKVLLTGSPRLCASTIWGPPGQAIIGDYETGLANFRRFLAALPASDDVREQAAGAIAVLEAPETRGRYLLLEVGEIVELMMAGDETDEEFAESFQDQLNECDDIDSWVRYAGSIGPDELAQATGDGSWTTVTYFQPHPVAEPPPQQPPPQQPPPQQLPPQQAAWQPAPVYASPPPPAIQVVPPPPETHTGSDAWMLGLLALIPVPGLSAVVASIAMAVSGRGHARYGSRPADVGRAAANWGLTYLVATVVLLGAHVWLLLTFASSGLVRGFYPLGIPLTGWLVISVLHLVFCAIGISRANRAVVFAPPSIPFFSSPR